MDVFVDDKTCFVPHNFLSELPSRVDINAKIHWWFKINGTDDIVRIISIAERYKVSTDTVRSSFHPKTAFLDDSGLKTIIVEDLVFECAQVRGNHCMRDIRP